MIADSPSNVVRFDICIRKRLDGFIRVATVIRRRSGKYGGFATGLPIRGIVVRLLA